MEIKRLSTNLGIALASRLITASLAIVVVGLMTRYLGASGYGEYATVLAYLFIFSILSDFGLYTILTREISRPGAKESEIASNIFTLRLTLVIALVLIAVGVSRFLPYSGNVKTGIVAASLFTVFSSQSQILAGVFQKYLSFYLVSLSDIVAKSIQLAVVYVAITGRLGFLYFIWAVVIASGIHFFIIFLLSQRFIKIRFRLNPAFWRKTVRLAVPVAASIAFTMVYFRLDTVMLSLMKPQPDVGIYGVAAKVLEFVIFFPTMYVGLVMPLLSRFAKTSPQDFRRVFRKTFDYLAILMVPVVVYLFILSGTVARIIGGSEFEPASVPIKLLALACAFIFFGALGGQSVVALNLQRYGMWAYFSGAVLDFSTNLIFIPIFSFNGAAATTVATELLVTVLLFHIIKKRTGHTISYSVLLKTLFAGLAMALVIYPFRTAALVVPLLLGALVYWVALYALKGFDREDIREFFKKRVPGVDEHVFDEMA